MSYIIQLSRHDHKPHIYAAENSLFRQVYDQYHMIYDEIWNGLVLKADLRAIQPFTHNIGDEFEAVGRKFVIIDYNPMIQIMTCATADAEGYRLLLHQLIFETELTLMMRGIWRSMPKYMAQECWDDLYRDN